MYLLKKKNRTLFLYWNKFRGWVFMYFFADYLWFLFTSGTAPNNDQIIENVIKTDKLGKVTEQDEK